MSVFDSLYDELAGRGIRTRYGELTIPGFREDDYEELYYYLIDELAEYIGSDFWGWYARQCYAFHRYKSRHTTRYEFHDPHLEKPFEDHTIQMQLAVLRFYIYRRKHSAYGKD